MPIMRDCGLLTGAIWGYYAKSTEQQEKLSTHSGQSQQYAQPLAKSIPEEPFFGIDCALEKYAKRNTFSSHSPDMAATRK